MMHSNFYSKILLFGEYAIIKNAKGLSIPYSSYKGCLKRDVPLSDVATLSNKSLYYFHQYLLDTANDVELLSALDLIKLGQDIKEGLYFDSSIPQGYGIGSSGALVAAVYAAYAHTPIVQSTVDGDAIIFLKEVFCTMESFFHGASSGLDPLNSYLSSPLLIHNHLNVEPMELPAANENGKGAIFLLDSGAEGQTAPMVKIFMQNMQDEHFSTMIKTQFIQSSDNCITAFVGGDHGELFNHVKSLSKTVLEHFKPMIPTTLHSIWQRGLDSNDYYLKLCGSGGGGYVLGFTRDLEKAKTSLKGQRLEVVCSL